MKRLLTLGAVVVLAFVSSGLLLAQSNPRVGRWKLNVAKSKSVNAQAQRVKRIPYELRVAVAGHRSSTDEPAVEHAIDGVLNERH
jgi:hypothetical protein